MFVNNSVKERITVQGLEARLSLNLWVYLRSIQNIPDNEHEDLDVWDTLHRSDSI